MSLLGRRNERATIEQVLARAQAGQGGVLVIRGEAGIGKTALLEDARATATAMGFRAEYAAGVESETQFAFAALHQLCVPLLDRAAALPDPQQAALGVAFGIRDGAAPDRFLVGLATLNLLAEVAEEGPLLCLVEDAQWLDQASAQVLAFVARRLVAERIALVFALRDPTDRDVRPFVDLPGLRLDGLGQKDARTLLAAAVGTPLDDVVRDRIVAEARGNPLALLELPKSALPSLLAGGFELPSALSVPRRVQDSFQQRSGSLPVDTQLLLLVAAADPTGDVALLWQAAEHLGIAREALAPAETAGLVEIDTRVQFRHPLVRSAIYTAAAPPDQRRAHRVLAAVTDPGIDPDRRAWHRAQAVLGTDEEAAAELEHTAGRARARGGLTAAAAFMEQAAMLTPEPGRRATRALEAAYARHDAGAPEAAMALLAIAEAGPLDPLQRARLQLLRAQIAFHLTRGSEAPGTLLDAARTLAPLDAALARETYLHALEASFHAGRLAPGRALLEAAEAARNAPPSPTPPRPVDLLLDGLVARYTQGYEASVPSLQRALASLRNDGSGSDNDHGRWLWLACHVGAMLWDDESIYMLADRAVRLAREAGALPTLPAALNALALALELTGELARASELIAEQDAITRATGAPPLPNSKLGLAAWRGRQHETSQLIATTIAEATARGEGLVVSSTELSLAYLHNGLGNYDSALGAATSLFEFDELAHSSFALPELIEAAVRAGQPEQAAAALDRLTSRASASGTQWALGMAARSRALTSTGPDAEDHYREAIERLANCRMATHLARAHLVYGEWLRRAGRRQDAREQLRTAHQLFSEMGTEAYADRAARELRATGENARKRTAQPTDALTAQELHIARLVATGATNREVGTQLFLSPRTIEAHLRSIFHKLDITSRRQIKDLQLP
ncbi:ATP-binding protein [Luteimonas salinisoli]|uniref:ATP-binding protein n=1 Tax=Luteimonas salinisoli TaxID=2752307 RepID=UPI001C5CC1C7|nr:LuxR family transcriptional regulator [Luteimonas salinisoli]